MQLAATHTLSVSQFSEAVNEQSSKQCVDETDLQTYSIRWA